MHSFRPPHSRRVGIFAGSSPFPEDRFARGVEALGHLGFSVHEPPEIRARAGYLAGDDATRLKVFERLLADSSVDVLWAARGGYGLHRLVDKLSAEALVEAGKPIVGFSDVCVVHSLAQRSGLISVHGPVVAQLGELDQATVFPALNRVLSGNWSGLRYSGNGPKVGDQKVRGPVLGGCLSVLAALVGTNLLPSFEGAIVLLEDVGEATYRIDRMLTHLRLAGVFRGAAGFAIGDLFECKPRTPSEPTAEEVMIERLGDDVPVVTGLPFGHGNRNQPIPLGAMAELDPESGELVFA